jgi:redox-sensitive bicupin YhaK (pirin superfamily)
MARTARRVEKIVRPEPVLEGAGVRLKRSIAGRALDYLDPFLLFDHFGSDDPADYLAGFPMHPHRGIETVTYMLEGEVRHEDTLGNAGILGAGDMQWMTAGGGILHEEMPGPGREGRMEGFQLWVNLPAKLKMTRPRYQDVRADAIPRVELEGGVQVRVIAGDIDGTPGAVTEIYADPLYLDVSVPQGGTFEHEVPDGHTVFAYLFRGAASFGTKREAEAIEASRLLVFGVGREIRVRAEAEGARFLLGAGRPLLEPIARHGPFVMNTRAEIEQALEDLRRGTFVHSE